MLLFCVLCVFVWGMRVRVSISIHYSNVFICAAARISTFKSEIHQRQQQQQQKKNQKTNKTNNKNPKTFHIKNIARQIIFFQTFI